MAKKGEKCHGITTTKSPNPRTFASHFCPAGFDESIFAAICKPLQEKVNQANQTDMENAKDYQCHWKGWLHVFLQCHKYCVWCGHVTGQSGSASQNFERFIWLTTLYVHPQYLFELHEKIAVASQAVTDEPLKLRNAIRIPPMSFTVAPAYCSQMISARAMALPCYELKHNFPNIYMEPMQMDNSEGKSCDTIPYMIINFGLWGPGLHWSRYTPSIYQIWGCLMQISRGKWSIWTSKRY